MKQTRRFLSLFLALALCLMPVTVMAEEDLTNIGVITKNEGAGSSVTLDAAGGKFPDGSSALKLNVSRGGDQARILDPVLEPVRDGYDFKGWRGTDGNVVDSGSLSGYQSAYTAVWEKEGDPEPDRGIVVSPPGEEDKPQGPFQVTFDANGGRFSDGKSEFVLTTSAGDDGYQVCGTNIPADPTREGYTFNGWDNITNRRSSFASRGATDANTRSILASFHISQHVKLQAKWESASAGSKAGKTIVFYMDETGGQSLANLKTNAQGRLDRLPDPPTREGYRFLGWIDLAKPEVILTEDYDFAANESYKVCGKWEAQSARVRVNFDPDGGIITEWKGKKVPALKSGQPPFAVDSDTGIDQNSGRGWTQTDEHGQLALPAAKREGYVLDGWYQGGDKVTEKTVFKAGADLKAKWSKGSPDGPFTVKFDLGYQNAPKTEVPKEQTVSKGGTVALPDGKKLTPPSTGLEFCAWCLRGDDGKLYTWKASGTVTADMTLVAGWVKKGTTVKDGEALPEVPASSAPSASGKSAFTDVPASSPFARAIAWAVEKGITNGTTPTTFSPGTTCSTGHILTFLWRANGSPEPTIQNPYQDEIPNAFKKAAIWAYEKGLVSGDTFGSVVYCTRADAVTYMWKLAGRPEAKKAAFKDVAASSDYAEAISWAVEKGVTNGTGDGTTFSPDNICTRGQIVTFLCRAYAD